MSEGARPGEPSASLPLRLSDQRRPTLAVEAGPERADEGGGARRRGGSDELTGLNEETRSPAQSAGLSGVAALEHHMRVGNPQEVVADVRANVGEMGARELPELRRCPNRSTAIHRNEPAGEPRLPGDPARVVGDESAAGFED